MSRIGVVSFPGTCDDRDAARAVRRCGGEAVALRHDVASLDGVDGVILPGGFSYGDYLRCGAIAGFAPVMDEVRRFADRGGPVLGVCNGFQVLCEVGLLPGVLRRNHHGRFVCCDATLRVAASCRWLAACAVGDELVIPVKHGDGAWFAPADEIARLDAAGRLVLRYAAPINGASADVAGVVSEQGNVFGLMPHPEHAVDALIGSTDGGHLIRGLLDLAARVTVSR